MTDNPLPDALVERWTRLLPADPRMDRMTQYTIGADDLRAILARAAIAACDKWQPRPMSDEAKTGATVLVYFKPYGWRTVEWNNRFLNIGETVTPENGIWCVNDEKNDVWHLRGYCDGDDTHWRPLPAPPTLSHKDSPHG
jgi:hypothetical protein